MFRARLRRCLVGLALGALCLASSAIAQSTDFRACAWGVTTCAGGGGGGGASVSPKYAVFAFDEAVINYMAPVASFGTYVRFGSVDSTPFVSILDPTSSFTWDDTNECFSYSGSNGTFEVDFSLSMEVPAGGANDRFHVALGKNNTRNLDWTITSSSSASLSHSRTHVVSASPIIDIDDMDCVDVWGTCDTVNNCDPIVVSGLVSFKQVAGTGGTVTGTATTAEYGIDHTATNAEIENGIVFFSCPGDCTLTLPTMGAGKTITAVNIPDQNLYILPDAGQLIETTDSAGDRLLNKSTDEDKITLVGKPDGNIAIFGKQGSWADAN